MSRRGTGLGAILVLVAGLGNTSDPLGSPETTAAEVRAREIAFAKSMADRDLAAFATFVSEEAVFLAATVLRGRDAVIEGWKPFFDGPEAPFSWAPPSPPPGSGSRTATGGSCWTAAVRRATALEPKQRGDEAAVS